MRTESDQYTKKAGTVASVVVGAGRAAHFERNADLAAAAPPPPELWHELIAQGLLRPDAPVPTS